MRNFIPTDRRSITAIKASKLLKDHGTEVSPERAKVILDFMYVFVKLSVKQLIYRDSDKISLEKRTPRKLFRQRLINKPNLKMEGEIL